ncbi:MAG: isopentenyl-diphosphate delta-isomerase [Saprospiraceae bacterium]|nr:isopentenyl-diphosphate delta-isomerase [Saprospiraceae bacterium]
MSEKDITAEQRKQDHIDLAFEAQLAGDKLDDRFYYEPLMGVHPGSSADLFPEIKIAGKTIGFPLWVSSMTGGAKHASTINANLAQACQAFGMGMGLGSCRILLEDDKYLPDFDVRHLIGQDLPFFANMGIAQIEKLIDDKSLGVLDDMIQKLQADGLIIHVNPLQEWFQPEGDDFSRKALDTIEFMTEKASYPLIVKEVGQGMGPKSLKALMQLPLEAIDFGAAGGTNFSLLEALRSEPERMKGMMPLANVGHTIYEMVDLLNEIIRELGDRRKCDLAIVSGGVRNFLDGYYCMQKLNMPAIYAQASALLKRALIGLDEVNTYLDVQKSGLQMAYQFLTLKR